MSEDPSSKFKKFPESEHVKMERLYVLGNRVMKIMALNRNAAPLGRVM